MTKAITFWDYVATILILLLLVSPLVWCGMQGFIWIRYADNCQKLGYASVDWTPRDGVVCIPRLDSPIPLSTLEAQEEND